MNLNSHIYNHTECAFPAYPESLIFYHHKISLVPNSPSGAIAKDPFAIYFMTINNYFYVLC